MSLPADLIGIGISTKDRWEDLALTLEHLLSGGLDALETMVIDDGSASPMPADFPRRFPWVKFERFEKSRGYIAQRNHLAQSLHAPFYFSLDDDSFPVAGSVMEAAIWMQEHPNVAVLGFRIIGREVEAPSIPAHAEPVPVRDFTGCGFLARRQLLLELGGFEERFQFYCEEMEYALRAVARGYEIYFSPSLVIRHMVSSHGRLVRPRTYILMRNHVLTPLWTYPFPISILCALWWALLKSPFPDQTSFGDRLNQLKGAAAGVGMSVRWFGAKRRLTHRQFWAWRRKPSISAL